MSTGGQAVGGIVGGIIGFVASGYNPSGALYGAQLGMMAGGYLDPPKGAKTSGPRLSDLRVQSGTLGTLIPREYGSVAFMGNLIWVQGDKLTEIIVKKKVKTGGKGGGSKATRDEPQYYATFAVGLCEGPIAGVRRIWIGPDLFYDAGSDDPGTIAANNAAALTFAVYKGTDTQNPDPRIQADKGAGNVSAWRGLAYIVFYDLALARYGNSLLGAQVKVEVFKTGTLDLYPHTYRSMPTARNYWCCAWSGSVFCALAINTNICATSPDGVTWTEHTLPVTATWYGIGYGNGVFVALLAGSDRCYTSPDGITWTERVLPAYGTCYAVAWNGNRFVIANASSDFFVSSNGITWSAVAHLGGRTDWYDIVWNPDLGLFAAISSMGAVVVTSPDGLTWASNSTGISNANWDKITCKNGRFLVSSSSNLGVLYSDNGSAWTHSNIAGTPTGVNSLTADTANFVAFDNTHFYVSPDGVNWTQYSLGGDYWTGAVYNGAVIVALDYTHTYYQAVTIIPSQLSIDVETLSDIVATECLKTGVLTASDIDVTSLAENVRGYLVSSFGTLRSALEPLQGAWPFDVVQAGYKIKFVLRKTNASVLTVPEADLGAYKIGDNAPPRLQTTRELDTLLPKRIGIQYMDADREYQGNYQYAERLNTVAINNVTFELPIVLSDTEAAGIAQTLLYVHWVERQVLEFSLPPSYLELEASDVIGITTPEGVISVRLTSVEVSSAGLLKCIGRPFSQTTYTPVAIGASGSAVGMTTISPVGKSKYYLLDVPRMSGAQDGPVFLAAMAGERDNWRGGFLMNSTDAGASWSSLEGFDPPGAVFGFCSNSLGVVDSRTIDFASQLSVTLVQGSLFSVSQLSMFGGENYFAYGADGRWEIIAAQFCDLTTGKTYVLSNLLRGRFGTEWAMSLHASGDVLVLLDSAEVAIIESSSGSIGLPSLYRGITVDQLITSDTDFSFVYRGVNLRPLSPVYFAGSRTASNDWILSWIRRTRKGGEWRDYVGAELGETTEAYQIDICTDSTYTVIKRTLAVTAAVCTYTLAQQVADFGAMQSAIYATVYQMSSKVGRGYPLHGAVTGDAGLTGRIFTATDDITYLERLPAALQTLDETFPADTGFTKYTESSAGTTAVASNKYTVTHVGSKNDIIVKNTISFSAPLAWVEASMTVTNTGATSYDNGGVGIVKDANNFVFASMDRLANTVRLQIKIGGSNTFLGTISQTWGTSFKLGLSLVANSACVWIDTGSGWTYKLGADVTSYYDFRTTGNLTSWHPGFTLANGGGNSTWDFSAFKAGSFGGVGMRDQTLVTDEYAGPYFPAADTILFTATAADPRGTAYCGVYTYNLATHVITQQAAIWVSRGGKIYNDLSAHIIRYAGGNRRMLISTWGNGFGGSIQTLHELFTTGDVLVGVNVVTMTAITLPGQTGASPGAYDAMMAWDSVGSQWVIVYTLVDNTNFAGNPFYPAVATSAAMTAFTLVAKDTGHPGYEGAKICNLSGTYYITVGGPAGLGNTARAYSSALVYLGEVNVALSGGADTQPHAMLFDYAGALKMLSFDNSRFASAAFTWGHLRTYSAL